MLELSITRRTMLGLLAAAAATPRNLLAQSGGSTRPRFHLTPSTEWINDPQRPIWWNNTWNLWVLWNSNYPNPTYGTEWRHYTSQDLVTWADQGVSIPKYTTSHGDVWTGSSVVDGGNSAGHGQNAIIALMTMPNDGPNGQDQSTALWYSTNGGKSFQFDSIVQQNPHTNGQVNSNFRDPSVFWYAPTGTWVMCLAEGNKIGLYTSANLHSWTYRSGMFSQFDNMECPNIVQLHLYKPDGSHSQDKWVLIVGADGSSTGFTRGTHYWVGNFDGVTFTPDEPNGHWLDGGSDCYATVAFVDANSSDRLSYALAISWQDNWDYAGNLKYPGYWGQLTVTRMLTLKSVNGTSILFNQPLPWFDKVFTSQVSGSNQNIGDPVAYQWPSWPSSPACRIDFIVSPVNGSWPGAFYFSVRGGPNCFTQVGFEPSNNNAFLNRSSCGGTPPTSDSAWSANRNVPCDFSGSVSVTVLVDANSIEVFLNGGRIAISELITAPLNATALNLTSFGGNGVQISNVVIKTVA